MVRIGDNVLKHHPDSPAAGTGPASRAYSSIGGMSPAWICSQFICSTGSSRSMNRRATRFFRSSFAPWPSSKWPMTIVMAESTSFRPERSRYGRALRLDELHGLDHPLPGFDELLLQLVQQRIVVNGLASCGSAQVSSEPEVTPRTAATTCNWLVPS